MTRETWWEWVRRFGGPRPTVDPALDVLGAASLPHDAVVIPRVEPPALVPPGLLHELGWRDAALYTRPLSRACRTYAIDTPARLAAFLAQVGHESMGGVYRREIWGPTKAQAGYEGRADLGNTQHGDGKRFLGRGLIQITGRRNTERAHQALRPAMLLEDFCAWLEGPEGAAESAAWWWAAHGCNDLCGPGDFLALSKRINGVNRATGLPNGMDDRRMRWVRAQAALGV